MNYYPELIKAIFNGIVGPNDANIISLIHDTASTDGPESNPKMGRLELPESLLIAESDNRRIGSSEQFVDDALTAIDQSEANCVFAFPPFLGRMRLNADFRNRFGQLTVAEACAQAVAEIGHVRALAILVPIPFLGNTSCGTWRRDFFPSHSSLVIEHAHDTSQKFSLPSSIALSFCTVVFTNAAGPVRFFKIDEHAVSSGIQRILSDLQRLLRQPAGRSQFGYVYQGPLSDRYPTTFDFYSDETRKLRQEISNLGERVSLEKIADVLVGFRPCRPDCNEEIGVTGFLKINASNISIDGNIAISDASIHDRPAIVSNYLQDGDFCVRQIYSADSGFVVGEFRGDGRRITWSQNVIVVRPKPELSPAQRQVLLRTYPKSDFALNCDCGPV